MAPASETSKPKQPQQQQQATNDNSGRSRALASGQQAQLTGATMMAMSAPQVPPPLRRPRPARPLMRRPIIVGAPGTDMSAPPPLQLAGVPPPKRPAHLPAAYVRGPYHPQLVAAGPGGVGGPVPASAAGSKPNRYAWAQFHHSPPAAGGAAGGHHGGFHHFAAPFSAASRGIMVVNPMQIVNLGAHTKSRLIKCIEAVKRFSEKWFSHVLLLLFLAIYACFGAYIFISFEASNEAQEKRQVEYNRQQILNETWDSAKEKDRDEFNVAFEAKFKQFEELLKKACASGTCSSQENQWNFWGALFYSMTVFTTIGYGHLTPITFGGRVATMIYAIFGIPILLMVLADLGKLLTRIIKYAFKKFRYLFNKLLGRKTTIRTRKLITDNTNQYIGVARDAFERGFAYIQPHHYGHAAGYDLSGRPNLAAANAASGEVVAGDGCSKAEGGGLTSRFFSRRRAAANNTDAGDDNKATVQKTDVIVTPVKQTKPVSPKVDDKKSLSSHHRAQSPGLSSQAKRKISSGSQKAKPKAVAAPATPAKGSVSRSSSSSIVATTSSSLAELKSSASKAKGDVEAPKAEQEELSVGEMEDGTAMVDDGYEDDDDIVDEFDIPVSFALFLLITYMMFGAVIFSIWEGWHFFDSLYFVFISMSTIGFGDLVPQHPKRMIGTFIYLLFGLALTSMCINVVQEKIHATFLRAKMQIGEKMGLDLEQIMADDYYDGSMGMDDDEDDSDAGMSLSQTNSTSAAAGGNNDDGDHHHHPHQQAAPATAASASAASVTIPATTSSSKQQRGKEGATSGSGGGGARRRAATGLPGHNNNSGSSFKRKSSRKQQASMARGQSHHKQQSQLQQQQQQVHLAAIKTAAAAALAPATAALTASNAITPAVASAAAAAASVPVAPPAAAAADNAASSPPATNNAPPDTTDQNSISSSFINNALSTSPINQQEPLRPEIEVLKRVEQFRSVSQPPGLVHPTVGIRSVCEPLATPLRRFNASAAHFFEKHHPARLRATISGSPQRSQTPVFKSLSSEPPANSSRGQPPAAQAHHYHNHNNNGDENRHYQHNGRQLGGRPHGGSSRWPSSSSSTGPRATTSSGRGGGRSSGSSRRSSVSHELNELDDLIIALAAKSPSERYGPLLGIPNSTTSGRSTRSNSPSNSLAKRATSMTNRRPAYSSSSSNNNNAPTTPTTNNNSSSSNYSSIDSNCNWASAMTTPTRDNLSDSSSSRRRRSTRNNSPGKFKDLNIKFARAEMIP